MIAMHLSLMEVLMNSLGEGVKEVYEKNLNISAEELRKIIEELESRN